IDEYARLLVERSVGVQPGWEVLIRSTPLARPLIEAVCERIARLGAYPLLQLAWEPTSGPFAREAPLEVLRVPPPTMTFLWKNCDACIMISAPENTREGADLSEERRQALLDRNKLFRERQMSMRVPWVVCEYPVHATAQEAGMTLDEYTEFIFGAVLLDWDAEGAKMQRIASGFDAAEEIRIVGAEPDPALHEARRLRCEDRRDDPPRRRQLVHLHRRHQHQPQPLGHRQGPAPRREALRRRRARTGRRRLAAHLERRRHPARGPGIADDQ